MKQKIINVSDCLMKAGLLIYAAFAAQGVSGQVAGMAVGLLGWGSGAVVRRNAFWMFDDENREALKVICAFLAVFLLSSAFSTVPAKSFDRFRLILGEMSFFFVALAAVREKKFLATLVAVILISASAESIYGIIQFFTGLNILKSEGVQAFGRVKGTMAHWNKLGSILGLILPLCAALALEKENRAKYGAAIYAACALITVCLVLTFTRGAWMGAAASVLVIGIIKEKRLIFALLIVAAVIFLVRPTRERITSTFDLGQSESLRIEMAKAGLKMFADRPVLGQGPNTFQTVFYEKYLTDKTRPYFDDGIRGFSHPHNTYIGILADTGIPGIAAFLFMLFYFFRRAVQTYMKTDGFYKAVSLGIIGTYTAFLVHGMVDYVFSAEPSYFFWLSTGILFSLKGVKS